MMATILETMEGLALPPGASETLKQGDSLTRHALGMRLAWPRYSPHDREAVGSASYDWTQTTSKARRGGEQK